MGRWVEGGGEEREVGMGRDDEDGGVGVFFVRWAAQ